MLRARLLVLSCVGLLAGCAAQVAPAVVAPPPPPPPPAAMPVAAQPAASIAAPATESGASLIISRAEHEFDLGRESFDRGRLVAARAHFDTALDLLLELPDGARSSVALQSSFDSLVERISALDIRALREADGIAEARSEPAAIDDLLGAALFEPPAPKATTRETAEADLAAHPTLVPIELNARVLSYVELFQGRLRNFFQAGLDRGQKYLPMIQSVFREEGVPVELSYLPLVESAFKSTALSRASARGMWQFMQPTAREHGLNQFDSPTANWFLDERSDPERSTRAAAQYLKTLNGMFDGDWNFALASYNAGPGRLQRAVSRAKTSDYWKLSASTRYLPRETREYVPMVLAAILIARNPALYGFSVSSAPPLVYETVTIPGALDLKIIAEWAEVTVEELQELNPELRRTTTPLTAHELKVPVGTGAAIQTQLETAEPLYRTFKFHTVKRGETVTTIARRYGISTAKLREANGLSSRARVSTSQVLQIPAPSTAALPSPTPASPGATVRAAPAGSSQTYRVRSGDTLFSIARQFSVSVSDLKRWNGLTSDRIKVGDRLTVRR
jgi:membrane-bound lytic murein transglycosylase D